MATWLNALKGYLRPKIFLFFFLGLSCGVPLNLLGASFSLWLTKKGIDLEQIGFLSLILLPYSLKFLWAPLIDNLCIPFLGKHLGLKKAWGVLFQLGLAGSLIGFAFAVQASSQIHSGIYLLGFLCCFFAASQDIVVDALRIDTLEEEELGEGAGTYQLGYRIGMLCSGAGLIALSSVISWRLGYLILATLISIGVLALLFVKEPTVRKEKSSFTEGIINPFLHYMKTPHWMLILLFIVLYKICNAVLGKMAMPFYAQNGFTDGEIALVSGTFGPWITMLGIPLGGLLVMRFGILKSLFGLGFVEITTSVAFAVLAHLGNNLPAFFIVIAFDNIVGGMGGAVFVAFLSSLCVRAYSATQYALLSALTMIATSVFASFSGILAHAFGWIHFFLLTGLLMFPALFVLFYLIRHPLPQK